MNERRREYQLRLRLLSDRFQPLCTAGLHMVAAPSVAVIGCTLDWKMEHTVAAVVGSIVPDALVHLALVGHKVVVVVMRRRQRQLP